VLLGPGDVPVLMDFGSAAVARKRITNRQEALLLQEDAAQNCSMPYTLAGPHGGRPRRRQHHAALPATAMGQGASLHPEQRPQPLRSHPPALQWPSQGCGSAPQPAYRYRAPELFDVPSDSTIDERTDIFSLGALVGC
jgi:hypothetical protein